MLLISSLIPFICITPAPPEEIHPDPYSPFSSQNLHVEDDGYRANWLSLPPLPPWQSSSLSPASRPPRQGLTQDKFASLLKVSRDQGVQPGAQRVSDVRKELAPQHRALKQLDRRALFLSKVNGPSCVSPILGDSPSPRRFRSKHPTLEIAAESSDDLSALNPAWDKRAELHSLLAEQPLASSKFPPLVTISRCIPPSLEEITAHLRLVHISSNRGCSRSQPLNSLQALNLSNHQYKANPAPFALNDATSDTTVTHQVIRPDSCDSCKMGARDTAIPHTVGVAAGSAVHTGRADTARDMIVTLMRRSSAPLRPVLDEWHRSEEMRLIATR